MKRILLAIVLWLASAQTAAATSIVARATSASGDVRYEGLVDLAAGATHTGPMAVFGFAVPEPGTLALLVFLLPLLRRVTSLRG